MGLEIHDIPLGIGLADDVSLIVDDIITIEINADMLLNPCKDIGSAVNIEKGKYMELGQVNET